jgi:F-type H+-transporting ATPase subunit delta
MKAKKINPRSLQIATPYAKSLIELTVSDKAITADIYTILELLTEIETLPDYFASPRISNETKKEFVTKFITPQITTKVVGNFLLLLLDRRRIALLQAICETFLTLLNEQDNVKTAEVTTVIPLTEQQELKLVQQLQKVSNSQKIEIVTKRDPSILGGMIIQIGSQIIDLSIKGELRNISTYLGNNFDF